MASLDTRPRHAATGGQVGRESRSSVRRSVAVAAAALLFAGLLDAEALEDTASSQPFGWKRDVATAAVGPVLDVSRALHLTAPRHWLESAFDRPSTRPEPAPVTSTTQPSPGSSSTVPPTTGTTPTTSTTVPGRRTPTATAPLRLLVAGDSMTEAAGPALLAATDATGVVRAVRELHYSSGLTRPDYFDWPARLTELVSQSDPEAVVVMLGANDAQGIQTPGGVAAFGSDRWIAEYRSRVASLMSQLTQDDRTVYWIGQPVMRSGTFDGRMRLLTEIYQDEAARHPGVRFIDTRPLFADANGSYAAYLPGGDGRPVLVRREDGIHLTAAGADRLTRVVMAAIEADWDIGGGA